MAERDIEVFLKHMKDAVSRYQHNVNILQDIAADQSRAGEEQRVCLFCRELSQMAYMF